ncbi:DUF5959 family protein [Streptomyces sp. NPDC020719]|uniref:DUF5959 family protein n=1 Tax=Streptomyces sp. NPDC020719 TaxID=3154896 RepID=UPI0033CD627D
MVCSALRGRHNELFIHAGPSTQIVVSVPLDLGDEWITESRRRLAAARAAFGVDAEDYGGVQP